MAESDGTNRTDHFSSKSLSRLFPVGYGVIANQMVISYGVIGERPFVIG
jgi:hypothetical protein